MHFDKRKVKRVMNILQLNSKSDVIGAFTGILCLVHCLAAPFLFVAQAGMVGHSKAQPYWWGLLDVIFLGISFVAVRWSGKTTSKKWMRNLLLACWAVLALIIFNEKFSWFHLAEQAIYIPTMSLVFLHLYKRKYCHCGEKECCVTKGVSS